MPTFHLLIIGKVQGVFYRATAKRVAKQLNLTGWIKNTDENVVESVVIGTQQQVEEFINWCKKGPENAKVENVIVTHKAEMWFKDFKIIKE